MYSALNLICWLCALTLDGLQLMSFGVLWQLQLNGFVQLLMSLFGTITSPDSLPLTWSV